MVYRQGISRGRLSIPQSVPILPQNRIDSLVFTRLIHYVTNTRLREAGKGVRTIILAANEGVPMGEAIRLSAMRYLMPCLWAKRRGV
jgi:hypothetical protein